MKKISLFFIVIFAIALALSACSSDATPEAPEEPKPTAVSNVPEQPEEAKPEESAPQEPEAPPEVKVDASKGLFDSAAVVESLDAYVLRPEDMPNPYKIVEDGEQHMTNLKVINSVGEVEGKRYIAAAERIDGWSLELQRVNKAELIPYTMISQVEVFDSLEGAETAFGPDWLPVYQETEDEEKAPNWLEDGCDFGNACVMYYYEKLDPATEVTMLEYVIVFIDRNVIAQVMGRGADYDMNPDYLVEVAGLLFNKIDAAPLAE